MFLHSILETQAAVVADGDEVIDLPVNPLSVILIHLTPLAETSTITAHAYLEAILSAVDNVRVTHKGSAVVDASGVDLAALALLYHNLPIWQSNSVETDDDRRSIVLPILFGRRPYMPGEAFPETRRGEYQLTITWDIADTGFDGLRRSIETIELPDASPEYVQKVTTLAQTFAATGQNDIDLPIGNTLRALLCFGATPFAGATPTPTLGQLELLVDNRQVGYSSTDFEVSRAIAGLTGVKYPPDFGHIHSVDASGAGREDTLDPQIGAGLQDNYTCLTLDTLMDDSHSIDTTGAGRVNVRIAAEAANAARVLPVERVPASNFTG